MLHDFEHIIMLYANTILAVIVYYLYIINVMRKLMYLILI